MCGSIVVCHVHSDPLPAPILSDLMRRLPLTQFARVAGSTNRKCEWADLGDSEPARSRVPAGVVTDSGSRPSLTRLSFVEQSGGVLRQPAAEGLPCRTSGAGTPLLPRPMTENEVAQALETLGLPVGFRKKGLSASNRDQNQGRWRGVCILSEWLPISGKMARLRPRFAS